MSLMQISWFQSFIKLFDISSSQFDPLEGFEFEGVHFFFKEDESSNSQCFLIYALVSHLPELTSSSLYEKLLQIQLLTSGPMVPVFGFEKTTRHLLILQNISYKSINPAQAIDLMKSIVKSVNATRELLQTDQSAYASKKIGVSYLNSATSSF